MSLANFIAGQNMETDQKQVEYARSESLLPKPRESKESKPQVLTVVPQDISPERVRNGSLYLPGGKESLECQSILNSVV